MICGLKYKEINMKVNDVVKVLEPFNETYPDTYTITEALQTEDSQEVYILGEIGAFSACYLEVV
jgi:hypothetical protein